MLFFVIYLLFPSFLGAFAGETQLTHIRPHHRRHGRLVSRTSGNFSETYNMTDYYHGNAFLTCVVPPTQETFTSPLLENGTSLPKTTLRMGTFNTRVGRMLRPRVWPSSKMMGRRCSLSTTTPFSRSEESEIRQFSNLVSFRNSITYPKTFQRSYQYKEEV
jgi:hypothetical protein